ncbi:MAG: 4Fe-4S dicluster domain-containing protein [Chloroflexi bacterium]|nr:4Fe-4S dicluster domain-containing protein [Chloroflexota bacterium]
MKLIEISHDTCVGCRLCVMICSLVKEGECSATGARIRIIRDEEFGNNLVAVCTQCAEAYCVESCPVSALSRDPETGAVLVDEGLCNGCEACIAACPIGAIYLDKDKGTIFKCDLCGGDPECVKFCSREAITLKDTDIDSAERKSFMVETSKLLSLV